MSIIKEDKSKREHALTLCEIGVVLLGNGHIDMALDTFNESLRVCPTAQGYTYRAWAVSEHGEYDRAIGDCMRAIRLDAAFGNPYNDIGVYLMELGRDELASSWFERAKNAENYEPRHYPYLNLGQLYLERNEQGRALAEFVKALELDPGNSIAEQAIANMKMDFEL